MGPDRLAPHVIGSTFKERPGFRRYTQGSAWPSALDRRRPDLGGFGRHGRLPDDQWPVAQDPGSTAGCPEGPVAQWAARGAPTASRQPVPGRAPAPGGGSALGGRLSDPSASADPSAPAGADAMPNDPRRAPPASQPPSRARRILHGPAVHLAPPLPSSPPRARPTYVAREGRCRGRAPAVLVDQRRVARFLGSGRPVSEAARFGTRVGLGAREAERMRGIEPPSQAWEACVLPLNHIRGIARILPTVPVRTSGRGAPQTL